MGVGHMDGWDIGIELSIVRGGGRGEIKVMNSATLTQCIMYKNVKHGWMLEKGFSLVQGDFDNGM